MQNVQPCSKSSSCKTEMNRLRHSLSFTARSGRALKESPEVAVHEHQQKPSKPHMGAKVRTRRSWSIRSGLLPFKCKARNEVGAMHGSLRESQRGFGLPASGSSRSSDASANAPSQRKSAPREQESLAWYPRGVCSKEEAECEAAMPREGDRRMQRSSSFAIAQLSVTEQRHAEQAPQPTVDGSGGQSDSTRSDGDCLVEVAVASAEATTSAAEATAAKRPPRPPALQMPPPAVRLALRSPASRVEGSSTARRRGASPCPSPSRRPLARSEHLRASDALRSPSRSASPGTMHFERKFVIGGESSPTCAPSPFRLTPSTSCEAAGASMQSPTPPSPRQTILSASAPSSLESSVSNCKAHDCHAEARRAAHVPCDAKHAGCVLTFEAADSPKSAGAVLAHGAVGGGGCGDTSAAATTTGALTATTTGAATAVVRRDATTLPAQTWWWREETMEAYLHETLEMRRTHSQRQLAAGGE
uniref:Uncharacterized protein n=2 Tax=Chrysotila carterae TaxID=13221 RepID=A0A7S4BJ01_CHRCT